MHAPYFGFSKIKKSSNGLYQKGKEIAENSNVVSG
jgi:hypothetical protein